MADFIQAEPLSGPPATQRTEVWVLFDDDAVYVSARCWEAHPERMIADEMRHDSLNISNNDNLGFGFDTFYDRRNAITFNVTPIGARMEGQITDERQFNMDWNPVYRVEVVLVVRHAGRPRGAVPVAQPGHQAVRHDRNDD
jgi:hypothetical protein